MCWVISKLANLQLNLFLLWLNSVLSPNVLSFRPAERLVQFLHLDCPKLVYFFPRRKMSTAISLT